MLAIAGIFRENQRKMARLQKKMSTADKARKKEQAPDEAVAGEAGKGPEKRVAQTAAASRDSERRAKAAQAAAKASAEPNFIQKGIQFFREVRVELKKVTWPNKKQTAGSTLVVIILVFIIASFLGLVDFGLSKLVQVVLA